MRGRRTTRLLPAVVLGLLLTGGCTSGTSSAPRATHPARSAAPSRVARAGCPGLAVALTAASGQRAQVGGALTVPVGTVLRLRVQGGCANQVTGRVPGGPLSTLSPRTWRAARAGRSFVEVELPMCAGVRASGRYPCLGGLGTLGTVTVVVTPGS